jgi:predicted nucleic-acid-binding Zn-ribbon protein
MCITLLVISNYDLKSNLRSCLRNKMSTTGVAPKTTHKLRTAEVCSKCTATNISLSALTCTGAKSVQTLRLICNKFLMFIWHQALKKFTNLCPGYTILPPFPLLRNSDGTGNLFGETAIGCTEKKYHFGGAGCTW